MKKIIGLILSMVVIMLAGCSEAEVPSMWQEENCIPIVVKFDYIDREEGDGVILEQEYQVIGNATHDVLKVLEEEKINIRNFFVDNYGVDVQRKLQKLNKIFLYTQDEYKGEYLNGFVDSTTNTVYLHKRILEDEVLLRSVLLHEIMHYIGVVPFIETDECHYLVEGFADALALRIAFCNEEPYNASRSYEMQRKLADQILVVDKQIVVNFLTDNAFNIAEYINEVLKDVPQYIAEGAETVDDVAYQLENCITCIYNGLADDETYYLVCLEAEGIVIAYCKTFNPTEEQIKQIGQNYLEGDW